MFSNSIVALITPFRNGLIDTVALEKLILFHIENGTDSIVVCGSTGEGILLSDDERETIIKVSLEIANKKIRIISGCSSPSTTEALRLVQKSEKLGVDGVLVIAPYYVKPTQEGIKAHFTEIHNNSNLNIILYNNPGRCAVDISCQTIAELAELPRITGLKDSNTDLTRVSKLKELVPSFTLLSGDDPTLLGFLAYGGDGAVSVTANIVPGLIKKLITSFKNGDIDEARRISTDTSNLSKALFLEPNPIPAKYALYKMGFCQNELKLPLTKLSLVNMKGIDQCLLNILKK